MAGETLARVEVEPITVLILIGQAPETLALDLNGDAMLLALVKLPAFGFLVLTHIKNYRAVQRLSMQVINNDKKLILFGIGICRGDGECGTISEPLRAD